MDTDKDRSDKNFDSDISFEDALDHLEETVLKLESGGIPLEEATNLYEDGMKLARKCSQILTEAEIKITQIQTAYGENFTPHTEEVE